MFRLERHQGFDVLLEVARDLTASLAPEERYARLLCSVRRIVACDAACLLRLDGDQLVPVAVQGLARCARSRRYDPAREPRLRAILDADDPVMFPADSAMPDPFDGLLADVPGGGRIHACMGCALRDDQGVVGALTIDALDPHAFDEVDSRLVATLGALAAAAMRTTALVEAVKHAGRPDADETQGLPFHPLAGSVAVPASIGRYKVVRRLGRGGMGSVYLAFDPVIERLIAIKVARPPIVESEGAHRRLVAEVRSIGRLRHPNIPIVFDVGAHDGGAFIAMEYVEGRTLADALAARRRAAAADTPGQGGAGVVDETELGRVLSWMEQLCAGLASAHAQGIVHCDIKPANLMVDRHGVLKILDFGISRLDGNCDTCPGILVGSVNYMSPEQARGERLDHSTDIFSAGAVFYELLAGRPAFAGTIRDGRLERGAGGVAPRLPRSIPVAVRRIVSRALQASPARRYRTCEQMRAAIAAARAKGAPVTP